MSDRPGPDASTTDGSPAMVEGTVAISGATRTARAPLALGVNYWQWTPTWGNDLAGTETAVRALGPSILRIGGHNNDTNNPDPFDDAEIDQAIAYARAIGAEPILQVPLLADVGDAAPSASGAAAMVTYANVTKQYGVKYFSIGNEPDLYPDPPDMLRPGYTPADYCSAAASFVPAMKAADPSIQIVGPDLSWKYQAGNAGNDWLSSILQGCGSLIDVVAVHRYPIDPAKTTIAAAAADAAAYRSTLTSIRALMSAAGAGDKPLAVTETNITWNGDPATTTLEASPGTLASGLWTADAFGIGLEQGLWTTAFWSISEGWKLGLLVEGSHAPRPTYRALELYAAHFGPTLLSVTSAPNGVHAYASRSAGDDATLVIVVNWSAARQDLTFTLSDVGAAGTTAQFLFDPLTMNAVQIRDSGESEAWTYGAAELEAGSPAEPIGAGPVDP